MLLMKVTGRKQEQRLLLCVLKKAARTPLSKAVPVESDVALATSNVAMSS
jgi:hypothetical protein